MTELYEFISTSITPGQIPAYLEFTDIDGVRAFRMWINQDIPREDLHPRFKFMSCKGKMVFNNHETIEFIKSRVYEPGYEGITDILNAVGIKYYDAWEIFKAFHGKHTRDDLEVQLVSRTI